MSISIIIPVYNGEKTIRILYNKIKSALDGYLPYEMIFVYDCGKDNSWKIIKELAERDHDHVRGFHFDKNYGQQSATVFGFKKASGDYIITLDEDNQHDPEYIPAMIKKLEDDKLDFVYGKFRKIEQPFFKVFLSFLLRRILCFMIPDLPPDYSSYRVIRKELTRKITETDSKFSFIDIELGKLSSKNDGLLINHFKRLKGSSSYTISILVKQTFDVLFGYSPLFKIFYQILFAFLILSLSLSFYLIVIHGIQLSTIAVIVLLILSIMFLIRINSFKRIQRKLYPLVIEQTDQAND
jgi:polyisoprenyl-phosphate glycosyltransferase